MHCHCSWPQQLPIITILGRLNNWAVVAVLPATPSAADHIQALIEHRFRSSLSSSSHSHLYFTAEMGQISSSVREYIAPSGHNIDFDGQVRRWQDSATQDDILRDLIRHATENSPDDAHYLCVTQDEINILRSIFGPRCHKRDSVPCWDQRTLLAYLDSQVPDAAKEPLQACSEVLYRSALYCASFPFLPSTDLLTFDGLQRAVTLLSGRELELLGPGEYILSGGVIMRKRTNAMSYGTTFRSLASGPGSESAILLRNPNEDVLDVLAAVQPILNVNTVPIMRDHLEPMAERLSEGQIPLEELDYEIAYDKVMWLD